MMYQADKYTTALLHFENGLTDDCGKVWQAVNGAVVSTAKVKSGNSSLGLNGSQQYITTPANADFNFGVGDFTIDFYHANNNPATKQILFNYGEGTYSTTYELLMSLNGNDVVLQVVSTTLSNVVITAKGAIKDNAWHHYAVVRNGKMLLLFIDGKLLAQQDIGVGALYDGTSEFRIGTGGNYNGLYYTNGYYDEFRISKGIARWTDSFDPANPAGTPGVPTLGDTLLKIVMSDSSEREYRVKSDEGMAFINWYKQTASTANNACYTFNDILDGSNEYLAFAKIISFKVLAVK